MRNLGFSVFDADNHLYETREAFTKFLPEDHRNLVRFIEVDGRVRLFVKNRVSFVAPNPTLEKVSPPGFYDDPTLPRVILSPEHFFEPGPRLEWMRESGIDRALLWPTLGLSIEERFPDDPAARQIVAHAFNQWLHEHWSFCYEDAVFPPPLISLADVDGALRELEWVLERGARAIYVQPSTVPGVRGRRSIARAEFDPFWEAVQDADVLVGMHSGDGGIQRYINDFEGNPDQDTEYRRSISQGERAFEMYIGMYERPTADLLASMICYGLFTRFPRLRFLPVEQGTAWVRPLLDRFAGLYARSPEMFEEDPVQAFLRNVTVHVFRDPDPVGLVKLLGVDNAVFGSDFPHPEGMADPISFVDEIASLPEEDQAKIMGGNLVRLMKLGEPAAAKAEVGAR